MDGKDYWQECVACAAEECDLTLTAEQLVYMADACDGAHENYGMAFYQPPASDRYNQIEREWQAKYKSLESQFNSYRDNAETAVKKALGQNSDTNVTIEEYGEVLRHGGRTERIQ